MLSIGQILQQRYEIIRPLKENGAVYEAFDRRFNLRVAVRELVSQTGKAEADFYREAQSLARLQHQSLPRILDFFGENGERFIVTDLIAGDDLKTALKQRGTPFSFAEIAVWTNQLLELFDYLHSLGIFHRAVKPANLKIQNGRAFLLGLDAMRDPLEVSPEVTASKSLQNYTPHFAPPELIKNQPFSAPSELYSLAATVYFLLAGKAPSDSLKRASAIVTDEKDSLLDIKSYRPDLPESFARTLMQTLSMNAKNRPASAKEMRERLNSINIQTAKKTEVLSLAEVETLETEQETLLHAKLPKTNPSPQNAPENRVYEPPPTQFQPPNQVQNVPLEAPQSVPNQGFEVRLDENSKVNQGLPPQNYQAAPTPNFNANPPNFFAAEIPTIESKRKAKTSSLPIIILASVLGFLLIGGSAVGLAIWKFAPNFGTTAGGGSIFVSEEETAKTNREKALEATAKAEALIQSSRYDDVIKFSQEAIAADSSYAPAYSFYGDACWDSMYEDVSSLSEMTEVQKSADKILELTRNAKEPEDFMARAWANLAKEKNDKAIDDATEAVKLKNNYVTALMIRASAYSSDKKNYPKALTDYAECIRLSPNYAQAYNNRSGVYAAQKNYKKAIEDLNKAIELLPEPRYYKYRGDVYLQQRKFKDANADYDTALSKDAKYRPARIGRGDALYAQQKWQAAMDEFKQARDLKPTDAYMHNIIANCYFSLRKWKEAVENYTEAIKNKDDFAVFYSNRAGAYRQLGKTDLAKKDEQKAKELKAKSKK